jgi:hypothetical protein
MAGSCVFGIWYTLKNLVNTIVGLIARCIMPSWSKWQDNQPLIIVVSVL